MNRCCLKLIKSLAIFTMMFEIMGVISGRPAFALQFSISGNIVRMAGPIVAGDDIAFAEFYKKAPKGQIKIVDLNSTGGKIAPALQIARIIRADGLVTLVDANRAICSSACTILFVSGVRRHYVNANAVVDGIGRFGGKGLGFHEGNDPLSGQNSHYSGAASAQMIAAYYEFGAGSAGDLLTKSPPNRLFYVSAATALSKGIATSLGNP